MHIDKKLMHRIFLLIAGAIVFAWLVLDTARATILFNRVWELISPFAAGAAIAFIFNVPMRAIENQLTDFHKLSIRRGLAIVLTILCLILIIMFVFELLVPQIRLTLASLSEKIPSFIDRTAQKLMVLIEENPELGPSPASGLSEWTGPHPPRVPPPLPAGNGVPGLHPSRYISGIPPGWWRPASAIPPGPGQA